jgi:hypothetical protein
MALDAVIQQWIRDKTKENSSEISHTKTPRNEELGIRN